MWFAWVEHPRYWQPALPANNNLLRNSFIKNAARRAAFSRKGKLLALLLLALALLVSDTAAGLASGLARGLALTAAALACAKILSF